MPQLTGATIICQLPVYRGDREVTPANCCGKTAKVIKIVVKVTVADAGFRKD